ncbi:MAG: adenylate/guanylate cyclase domain-containing protein [Kiritimatiellaeota bacterium]|nr:adenylate/guanylate cyclase domain-containing protein [Kiritimatiellota bacterium]
MERWEYTTWTWRVRHFAAPGAATPQVKLILLDQASLDWGKDPARGWAWPWPRTVYSAILDYCQRCGAKAVGFDVLFTEPSAYEVSDDEALAAGIRQGPPFAAAVMPSDKAGVTNWPAGVPAPRLTVKGLAAWTDGAAHPATRSEHWKNAARASFPIPQVATNATLLANVSDLPDGDGIFRRATLLRVFDGRALPSLGLAVYLAAHPAAKMEIERGQLRLDGQVLPMDNRGRAILRYRGRSQTHQTFGAAAIIQSELSWKEGKPPLLPGTNTFRNAYVLFGFSAPGLLDLRPSPISKVYPGVEIHATMLDNYLAGDFIRPAGPGWVVLGVLAMTLAAGLAGTLSRKPWQSVLAFVALLPVPVAAGYAGYALGCWWPVMDGEVGVGLALVGAVGVNYATEGRQKAFIKSAFKHYLGPDVIEQIIADPARLQLGGEKRALTIYFSDIEKFSGFSERLDPPTLTALLNDYLTAMGAIIQAEGGYLDKFIGDAIVAFWNAPLGQADHAARACRAALRCQRRLAELRPEFQQRTGAVVKCRIGVNTGDVVVGNMGSRERFNYTILGDAANLASRLEGANKAFGTYLMVSETTWQQSGGKFVGRELGRLRVVGRKTPVKVYELAGLPGEERPAHFAAFEAALVLFYAGQFPAALAAFEKLPDDPAAKSYAVQCRALQAQPPADWDGVWSLTEK